MGNNEPFFLVYFGRQHSGKTYDLQRFVQNCGRSSVFVYNSGRDEDWQGYEEIELWSDKKSEKLFFTYKGKDYEFATHYMKKFRGKKVKAMEADEVLTETLLYKQLKVKGRFKGLFFIIDDATNILTSKLTKAQKSCFYRAKHVDVWFCLIFHDPNMFPNGAWNALTMAKFFKNNVAPPKQKSDKIPHFRQMQQAYAKLQTAPNYSYCTLVMNTGKLTYTPYRKPRKTTTNVNRTTKTRRTTKKTIQKKTTRT
ncbi:hypothetical protein [Aureispira anguillae]|uniref:Zonular occludens toxin (Zot) n=1 Tax=Aureispira anguillae TaxID=2864201 RepID=A0A915YH83_9BACT|nr:hypothetical protein [Aureispira anguillae]BDS13005.1 hypothetical protein AsAng_0037330 [Aureispira anguillae]BDS13069.1 hypothetical protein AsAng_0037970 [Aureispira anguillae]